MIDGKESVANSVMIPKFTLLEAHDSRPNASSARIWACPRHAASW